MSQAIIGGNQRYPSLQGICDLFRAQINDTFSNSMGSGTGQGGGGGLVMNDTNPDILVLLNAACLDTFAELRNVGSPELILDNWIVSGLPALTQPDASVQVALGYAGYFDGYQWHPQWTLPIGLSRILAVNQRVTNSVDGRGDRGADARRGRDGRSNRCGCRCPAGASGFAFGECHHYPAGIPGALQGLLMSGWEMRQGALWLSGCLSEIDLRIRCRITFPPFLSTAARVIDFSTAYVPILESLNAIADKMLVRYARRFAPELLPVAKDAEQESMGKLRLESVRERQSAENERGEFGAAATTDFLIPWAWF